MKQITVRLTDSDYRTFCRLKNILDEKKDATALRLLIDRFSSLHDLCDSLKKSNYERQGAILYLENKNKSLLAEIERKELEKF
ncbi:MAG: hypothetical protein QXX12_03305 [Nanopusillaceae archaeon]